MRNALSVIYLTEKFTISHFPAVKEYRSLDVVSIYRIKWSIQLTETTSVPK